MDNIVKSGTVYYVKSRNSYDENYKGMTWGASLVLILSVYYDKENPNNSTFTYFKTYEHKRDNTYMLSLSNDNYIYVDVSKIHIGDIRALDYKIKNLSHMQMRYIIKLGINYKEAHPEENIRQIIIKKKAELNKSDKQIQIHKFGIDIYVTESEDVKVTKSKKLKLSKRAKDDIIYNSKTDEDIRILCDKYKIYPIKAIKEIRNRLAYQHRQKEQ